MFTSSAFLTAWVVIYSTHVRVVLRYFYTSSCETPIRHSCCALLHKPEHQGTTNTAIQMYRIKFASSHTFFYAWVCCHCCWLCVDLPSSHPGGPAGECMVRSRAVHGGGVHQREARHRGEHPAGNRLHQQRLVRKTRETGWIGLHVCWLTVDVVFSPSSKSCSIGMVLPLWSDTKIHLDGDGWVQTVTHPL